MITALFFLHLDKKINRKNGKIIPQITTLWCFNYYEPYTKQQSKC